MVLRGELVQTIVLKYGGSMKEDSTLLLEEVAYYAQRGVRFVIVHGGGPEVTQWLARLGHETEFVQGQRVTDEFSLQVVEMVLAGRVGKRIVRQLQQFGIEAISISGEDGPIIAATLYEEGLLGYVGQVETVNTSLLEVLLAAKIVPVLAPLGLDAAGQLYNINADFVAASLAGALRANAFILATDVSGVREHAQSAHTLDRLTADEALAMVHDGRAVGGMIPKLQAAVGAIAQGAKAAYVLDGQKADTLQRVLEDRAVGTRIMPSEMVRGGTDHA